MCSPHDEPSVHGRIRVGKDTRPLVCASWHGHVAVVRLLLEAFAAPGIAAHDDRTPVVAACAAGRLEVVQVLLDAGAQVDEADASGATPLATASTRGHLELARLLVKVGAAVDKTDKAGRTPLASVSAAGLVEVACMLLQASSDINKADNAGSTPLAFACAEGHLGMARTLVMSGADKDKPKHVGSTPLLLASYRDTWEYFFKFVGTRLPKQQLQLSCLLGFPSSAEACSSGCLEVARMLVESRADKDRPNNFGRTPLAMACSWGHIEAWQPSGTLLCPCFGSGLPSGAAKRYPL